MPDLGKYAVEVLSAYAVTLALLAVFVIWTVIQGRRVRAEMEAVENARQGQSDG